MDQGFHWGNGEKGSLYRRLYRKKWQDLATDNGGSVGGWGVKDEGSAQQGGKFVVDRYDMGAERGWFGWKELGFGHPSRDV